MISEIENAVITGTMLGIEKNGFLTAFVDLSFSSAHQRFGGYAFVDECGWEWIRSVLETVGVKNWEDLTGRYVRAVRCNEKVFRIGNIVEDKWFDLGANAMLESL